MRAIKQNYLQILALEMEDLELDIQALIRQWDEEANIHSSQNVVLFNLALFRNELLGVGAFRRILAEIDPAKYETLADLILDVRRQFRMLLQSHGFAEALWGCIERKIRKVTRYVTDCYDAFPPV